MFCRKNKIINAKDEFLKHLKQLKDKPIKSATATYVYKNEIGHLCSKTIKYIGTDWNDFVNSIDFVYNTKKSYLEVTIWLDDSHCEHSITYSDGMYPE